MARPSSFREEYIDQAYKYCLLGADDVQLGELFGVSERTINTWKHKHPDFLQSLKKGKTMADAEIAHALYHRAKGYSHPDVEIKVVGGEVKMIDVIKHYPPDTGAAMAWLKNRRPGNWRDRPEEGQQQTTGRLVNYKRISGNDNRE